MRKKFFCWAAILAAALTAMQSRVGLATDFTYIGGATADWSVGANWQEPLLSGGFPNAATHNAAINTAATITIGEPITVGNLVLNAAVTIDGAGSLRATTITTSADTTLAVNLAAAPTTLTMAAGNALNINGVLSVAATQTLRNSSSGASTVNFNGGIEVGSGSTLNLRVDNAAGVVNFNSAISGAGNMAYFGPGTFNHLTANTYTGNTTLGANTPNSSSIHVLSTDLAFGTGNINFTGGTASQILQGDGTGPRTLANRIQLSREATFAGTDSFTLTGPVFQSNQRSLINNISGAGTLTLTGNVFTANSNDPRVFVFTGSGTTLLSAAVYDRIDTANNNTPTPLDGFVGSLGYRGTGRLILDNNFQANYTGFTEITSGTVQLGVGAAAVSLNGGPIRGVAPTSTAAVGTLDIFQNTNVSLGPISGQLNIVSRGGGSINMNGISFGTGTIQSLDGGTININGGTLEGTTILDAERPFSPQLRVAAAQAANLIIGQSLTVSGQSFNANTGVTTNFSEERFILGLVDDGNGRFIINLSGNVTRDNVDDLYQVVADAGTGTGMRNVVANGGRVAGNGVIGGNLVAAPTVGSVIAPGQSIGTLTANGNANILGTLEIEFNGTDIDLLAVGGDLTLGANSILDLRSLGGPLTQESYVFATYGGSLTGTFGTILGLQSGYMINYAFGGNNIAVTVVPEPTSLLVLLPIACAAAFRRRRS